MSAIADSNANAVSLNVSDSEPEYEQSESKFYNNGTKNEKTTDYLGHYRGYPDSARDLYDEGQWQAWLCDVGN